MGDPSKMVFSFMIISDDYYEWNFRYVFMYLDSFLVSAIEWRLGNKKENLPLCGLSVLLRLKLGTWNFVSNSKAKWLLHDYFREWISGIYEIGETPIMFWLSSSSSKIVITLKSQAHKYDEFWFLYATILPFCLHFQRNHLFGNKTKEILSISISLVFHSLIHVNGKSRWY